jgi:hypothetical protein
MEQNKIQQLDKMETAAKQRAKIADQCLESANTLNIKLRHIAKENPEVLEKFFNVPLIRDDDGTVSRMKNGQVKGYYTWMAASAIDHGLTGIIQNYVKNERLKCNKTR